MIRKNIGLVDAVLRVVAGVGLILFALKLGFADTGWNWLGFIGIVPLATVLLGNCPLYTLLGFSTRGGRVHG